MGSPTDARRVGFAPPRRRLIERGDVSYVIKELSNHLVEREYRLLRELDDAGLPTAEVVAAVTGKPDSADAPDEIIAVNNDDD